MRTTSGFSSPTLSSGFEKSSRNVGNRKRSIRNLGQNALLLSAAVLSLTFEGLNCSFVINGFPSTFPGLVFINFALCVRVGKVNFRIASAVLITQLYNSNKSRKKKKMVLLSTVVNVIALILGKKKKTKIKTVELL